MILEHQIHLLYHLNYSAFLREEFANGRYDQFPYPLDEQGVQLLHRTGLERLDMIGENHVSQMVRKWTTRLFPRTFSFLLEDSSLAELLQEYMAYSRRTPVHHRMDVDISPNRFAQFMLDRVHRDAFLSDVFTHEFLLLNMSGVIPETRYAKVELDKGRLTDAVYFKTYNYQVNRIKERTDAQELERPLHIVYLNVNGRALNAPIPAAAYQYFAQGEGPLDPQDVYDLLTKK